MPQKSAAKSNPAPSAKVVVFGIDDDKWLPRAAWFPKSQADAARAAARQFHLNVVEVTNGTAADLGAKIPAGQIHATGPSVVPPIREDLYEKVVAAINPRGKAGQAPGQPTDPAFRGTWDAIKPGHLVLARESLRQGWYEAMVVDKTGDKVTLQWRDYGGHPNFTVPVADVAVLNPTRS